MSVVDLARLQFASTSIYHFLFVPLTIGLSLITATLQTRWYRTGEPEYLRLTRFRPPLPRAGAGPQPEQPLGRPASWLLAWLAAWLIMRAVAAGVSAHAEGSRGHV